MTWLRSLLDLLCDETAPQNVDETVSQVKQDARSIMNEDLETAIALKGLVDGMVSKYQRRLRIENERKKRKPHLP